MHDPTAHRTTTKAPSPRPPPAATDGAFRVGIGGPVGTGKTALVAALCGAAVRRSARSASSPTTSTRPRTPTPCGAAACCPPSASSRSQTGCCPHTAIRDDITANLDAIEDLEEREGPLDLLLLESGGDNLTLTFSHGPDRRAALRARRGRRRQGAAQGRPGRHPLGPAGDQQDRHRPPGGRRSRRDGTGLRPPSAATCPCGSSRWSTRQTIRTCPRRPGLGRGASPTKFLGDTGDPLHIPARPPHRPRCPPPPGRP